MPRAQGQLDRALAALTLGVQRDLADRAKQNDPQGECVQQVRLPFSGKAVAGSWASAVAKFTWIQPFLYAPGQRLVPYTTPQFHYAVVFRKTPSDDPTDFIVFHAHVLEWNITPENWVIGATVQIGASAPDAADEVPFKAELHLTFQGYASHMED